MNILNNNIIFLTLIATLFTSLITTLGSSLVFFFKHINKNLLDAMLGLSAGVMTAASFFSLLNPSIVLSKNLNMNSWFILLIGFSSGGIILYISSILFNKIIVFKNNKINLKRCIMLFTSITIHNIPEGMAIGVAFASTIFNIDGATVKSAIILALSIGIQNFPEGSAVALPLRSEGMSRFKAFIFGSISGIIEIFAGILGAFLVLKIRTLLPYLLAFAAGAMIFVVVEELIPESQTNKNKDFMALLTLVGFLIMMILDVALN